MLFHLNTYNIHVNHIHDLSTDTRKPALCLPKEAKTQSAYTSTQSDQYLCCLLKTDYHFCNFCSFTIASVAEQEQLCLISWKLLKTGSLAMRLVYKFSSIIDTSNILELVQ